MPDLFPLELPPDMLTVASYLYHLFPVILEALIRLLVLPVDISYDYVLGLVTLLLPEQLALERLDPLAELIELHEETVVVVLQLMRHLTHRFTFSLLLLHLLSPVLLALAELLQCIIPLLGHSLKSDVHVFNVRVQFFY
jgi:hypothetical protein